MWNGSTFSSEAKLLASDGDAGDGLGWSVSIAGDLAVLGAPYDEARGAGSGAAYVFRRSGSSWTQERKLVDPASDADDNFGWAVSASADRIVMGGPRVDQYSIPSGAARVFRMGPGGWQTGRRLVPATTYGALGQAVAIAGERVLVGAPQTISTGSLAGAGFVFRASPVLEQILPGQERP